MQPPATSAVHLAPGPVGGPGGAGQPRHRRPYTTAELRLIAQLYPTCTAAEVAQRLGRTVGSLRGFIQARPALHKRLRLP